MVRDVSIRDKFMELSAHYASRGIDDFSTFICARVADYFINNEGASTETIFAEIEEALAEPGAGIVMDALDTDAFVGAEDDAIDNDSAGAEDDAIGDDSAGAEDDAIGDDAAGNIPPSSPE